MSNILAKMLAGCVLLLVGAIAAADTVTYNFNSTVLPSSLTLDSTGSDFSLMLNGTQAVLQQAANGGAFGWITVTSSFLLTGDFTVSIQADRSNLQKAQAGLGLSFGSDVFYVGTEKINANIGPYPAAWGFSTPDSTSQFVTFKLVRTGDTIFAYYNPGTGDILLGSNTDSALAADTHANFFLIQAADGPGPESAAFDNFTLSTRVPEPSTVLLVLPGIATLVGLRRQFTGRAK